MLSSVIIDIIFTNTVRQYLQNFGDSFISRLQSSRRPSPSSSPRFFTFHRHRQAIVSSLPLATSLLVIADYYCFSPNTLRRRLFSLRHTAFFVTTTFIYY
jgi:hypothetical protein